MIDKRIRGTKFHPRELGEVDTQSAHSMTAQVQFMHNERKFEAVQIKSVSKSNLRGTIVMVIGGSIESNIAEYSTDKITVLL